MYTNYFFIRRIGKELSEKLPGSILSECYSQSKDELILKFDSPDHSLLIQAHLTSEFSILSFPADHSRARRNTVNIFQELINLKVTKVHLYEGERAFSLQFEDGYLLFFKLFGNKSNLILYKDKKLLKLFKSNIKQDILLDPEIMGRTINYEILADFKIKDFPKDFAFIGKEVVSFLKEKGYDDKNVDERKILIFRLLNILESGLLYIIKKNGIYELSFFNNHEIVKHYEYALEAATAYFHYHFRYNLIQKLKDRLRIKIQQDINRTKAYLEKVNLKLTDLTEKTSPGNIADIIMANLYVIPKDAEEVELLNFYDNSLITIKLNPKMTPQRNAESYYQKAKKRPLEINKIKEVLSSKELKLEDLIADLALLDEIDFYKELLPLLNKYSKETDASDTEPEERFKTFEMMGFKIYVGRNANNNDELTQKFAKKDDLWLHAKDVSGSHVIIKYQPGKKFPKPVIEKAASVAAYYSKRKNDSLCPVVYISKKYVRKVKGAPAGAVKLDREEVIMVKPEEI